MAGVRQARSEDWPQATAFQFLSFQSGPRATPRHDFSVSYWGRCELLSVIHQIFTEHQAWL